MAARLGLLALAIVAGCARAGPATVGPSTPAPPGEPRPARAVGTVYTADEGSAAISAMDVASGRVRSVTLGIAPHNVQIAADGSLLLAVGSGEGHHDGGALYVMRPQDIERPRAMIPVGSHPAHVVADRAGRRAYVTLAGDDALAVVDLTERRVVDTIAICDGPHGLRLRPDEREIWVACTDSGELGIVDLARGEMVGRVGVGQAPVQVGFTPDGRRVYATLGDEDAVAAVDVGARRVRARIPVGRNPVQLHAAPDGRLVYVANQGAAERPDDTVSVVDTATDAVTATVTTGAGAHGVAVSGDGALVFVTNTFAGTLSTIDVGAQRVVRTVDVGRLPGGVTWSPLPEEGPAEQALLR